MRILNVLLDDHHHQNAIHLLLRWESLSWAEIKLSMLHIIGLNGGDIEQMGAPKINKVSFMSTALALNFLSFIDILRAL